MHHRCKTPQQALIKRRLGIKVSTIGQLQSRRHLPTSNKSRRPGWVSLQMSLNIVCADVFAAELVKCNTSLGMIT